MRFKPTYATLKQALLTHECRGFSPSNPMMLLGPIGLAIIAERPRHLTFMLAIYMVVAVLFWMAALAIHAVLTLLIVYDLKRQCDWRRKVKMAVAAEAPSENNITPDHSKTRPLPTLGAGLNERLSNEKPVESTTKLPPKSRVKRKSLQEQGV